MNQDMRYRAIIYREGRFTLAEFPDCPGCQTFAEPGEDIAERAREALEGWLEAHLVVGEAPPRPSRVLRKSGASRILRCEVPARLAVKLELRWARQRVGLTQEALARRAGVTQPMIAKMENPDYNPTIETLEKVAKALGVRLEVSLKAIR